MANFVLLLFWNLLTASSAALLSTNAGESATKGRTKNGTMHSLFQLKTLTKLSEFNERTSNYLTNKQTKNKKQTKQKTNKKRRIKDN